jgi:hypothetical protein
MKRACDSFNKIYVRRFSGSDNNKIINQGLMGKPGSVSISDSGLRRNHSIGKKVEYMVNTLKTYHSRVFFDRRGFYPLPPPPPNGIVSRQGFSREFPSTLPISIGDATAAGQSPGRVKFNP